MSDTILLGIVVATANAISNGIGFRAVAKDLGEKLKNKIDVAEHRASMTQLHNEKNELALKVAKLQAEVEHLKASK